MDSRLEKFEEAGARKGAFRIGSTWYWKFESPGTTAVPDRIPMPKNLPPIFQEVKRRRAKPRADQRSRMVAMRRHGLPVCWADNEKELLQQIQTWIEVCRKHGLEELYMKCVKEFNQATGKITR